MTTIETHPVIINIIENHADIARRMQAAIRKHRREQRAAECGINTAASCVAECEAEIRNYCRDEFGTQQGMGALKW